MRTVLDTAADRLGGPVLELQLHPAGGEPPPASARVRSIAPELEQRLRDARPRTSSLGTHFSVEWDVRPTVTADLVSAQVHSRFPAAGFNAVQPELPAYLQARRDRGLAAALRLRRNSLSAMVDEASLTQAAAHLLRVGSDLLPSQDSVVPLLRLGPLGRVSPGDPTTLRNSSAGATLPWRSRGTAASTGRDSVTMKYLCAHLDEIAEELVPQLVADLDRPSGG